MSKPVIAIEHLEEELSPWLLLEYRHSSLIVGRDRLWFTNVPIRLHSILSRYGRVFSESILEIMEHSRILILDPRATRLLEPEDIEAVEVVVIGGIMGDHPPRGMTWEYLSRHAPRALKRSLGDGQYSIDGAVYVVEKVIEGYTLDSIEYVDGIELKTIVDGIEYCIRLPFRYPVVDNKPLLAPGLREYLFYKRIPSYILRELPFPVLGHRGSL